MKKERELHPVEIKFLRVEIGKRDNGDYYATPIYRVRQCELRDGHPIPAESREYRGDSFDDVRIESHLILESAFNLNKVVELWAHYGSMESDDNLRNLFKKIIDNEYLSDDARKEAENTLKRFNG